MSSLALFLLFCVSMHACNARHLGVIRKEAHHFGVEDGEKTKPSELSLVSIIPTSTSKELHTQQQSTILEKSIRLTLESWVRATANLMKQNDSKAQEEEETKGATSGSNERDEKIVSSSSKGSLQHATKLKVMKKQARSMLGSAAPNDSEETVDSMEASIVEDIVVMDYAQPHRKPPIHNEEP